MNTFAFITAPDLNQSKLEAWKNTLKKHIPRLDYEVEESTALLEDASCAWFWLREISTPQTTLISEARNWHYTVLAYGQVLGSPSAAQAILDAWTQNETKAVEELNGNFGAVIFDRTERTVHLVSDLIGHRSLRYWRNDEMFIASPHDLTLISTGFVPADIDYHCVAGSAVSEWVWQGKSLLRHVNTTRGGDYVRWHKGHLQHKPAQLLNPSARIDVNNHGEIRRTFQDLISVARENVRPLKEYPTVHTELTAGEDSRAVLSLLLAEVPRSQIVAVTDGKPASTDVRVAAQIAKLYKVRHVISELETPYASVDDFKRWLAAYAFAMNGDADAQYVAGGRRKYRVLDSYACSGSGIEVFRGYYYDHPKYKGRTLALSNFVPKLLREKSLSRLPWSAPEYPESVRAQLTACLDNLSAESKNVHDILDLYYLRERYGVWGSLISRWYRDRRKYTPLISPQLVRLAYRMPSPIGNHAAYSRECISRFMPRASWVRVNENYLLPLKSDGKWTNLFSKIDQVVQKRIKRRAAQSATSENTPQQIHAAAFAGPLFDYLRDTFTADGSAALELFGRAGTEQLLEEHRSRTKDHVYLLGMLLTAERFRQMTKEIRA